MPKPIFLVGLPMSRTDHHQYERVALELTKKLMDYHVLVYPTIEVEPQYKCFYEKDFDEVKFEELKQIVRER